MTTATVAFQAKLFTVQTEVGELVGTLAVSAIAVGRHVDGKDSH